MKTFFYLIIVFFGHMPIVHASISAMPKPDIIAIFGQQDQDIIELRDHLKKGDLEEFYRNAELILKGLAASDGEKLQPDELKKLFWLYYWAASAPLYQMDYDEKTESPADEDKDYESKKDILDSMESLSWSIKEIADKYHVRKEDLSRLLAHYSSMIVKTFRQAYDKDLETKHQQMLAEYDKKEKEAMKACKPGDEERIFYILDDRAINFNNKILLHKDRNDSFKWNLDEYLEREWVDILMRCYPGQAAALKRYIAMGGYTDREMPELLNRTLGRTKETECLYKGFGKKAHRSSEGEVHKNQ